MHACPCRAEYRTYLQDVTDGDLVIAVRGRGVGVRRSLRLRGDPGRDGHSGADGALLRGVYGRGVGPLHGVVSDGPRRRLQRLRDLDLGVLLFVDDSTAAPVRKALVVGRRDGHAGVEHPARATGVGLGVGLAVYSAFGLRHGSGV